MGAECCASKPGYETQIDINVAKDKEYQKNLKRIILLGPGDSGKTTILKQMKMIHHGQIEDDEKKSYATVIRESLLSNMQELCRQAIKLHQSKQINVEIDKSCHGCVEYVLEHEFDEEKTIDDTLKNHIKSLWKDDGIQAAFSMRNEFNLQENSEFFFGKIDEIAKESYLPSFEDYLRSRQITTGLQEYTFETVLNNQRCYFQITDVGGQRCERKKWIDMTNDNMHAVLYLMGISGYDKFLFEDLNVNRIQEALDLFTQIMKKKFLRDKSVIIFLNKYDLFQEKIKTIPVNKYLKGFPENQDPNDEEDALDFLKGLLMERYTADDQVENQGSTIFTHLTTAIDRDLIERTMKSVQMGLIHRNINQSGM